jgi:hypothetical protein
VLVFSVADHDCLPSSYSVLQTAFCKVQSIAVRWSGITVVRKSIPASSDILFLQIGAPAISGAKMDYGIGYFYRAPYVYGQSPVKYRIVEAQHCKNQAILRQNSARLTIRDANCRLTLHR